MFCEAIYGLMAKFGWTFEQIKRLSMPTFFELFKLIEKEKKLIEREQKRMKHG